MSFLEAASRTTLSDWVSVLAFSLLAFVPGLGPALLDQKSVGYFIDAPSLPGLSNTNFAQNADLGSFFGCSCSCSKRQIEGLYALCSAFSC